MKNFLLPIGVGFVAVSLLAGCGSRGDSAVATTSTSGAAAAPPSPSSSSTSSSSSSERPVTNIRTINVNGVGKKSQAPDQVTVTMGVETHGATAALALKENNSKAAELIRVLKESGVEDRYLQTSQLSIYPQYDNTGRRVTGYTVSNIVTATLKDVKGAGGLIDAAASVAGDAIRVQGLSFGLSESADALKVARERAVADAKTQAEQLAAAAGVKLGVLRTISTVSMNMPVPLYNQNVMMARSADAGAVPLEAGAQEVSAEVQLVYEIA